MIYEIRVYEAAEGRADAMRRRFREHAAARFFPAHGIELVGVFTAPVEDGRLTYMTRFADEDARKKAWAGFGAIQSGIRVDGGWGGLVGLTGDLRELSFDRPGIGLRCLRVFCATGDQRQQHHSQVRRMFFVVHEFLLDMFNFRQDGLAAVELSSSVTPQRASKQITK